MILPGALPSIFVGLRYALGIMWLTLIVAETISASSGIGYMAMNAREFMLVDVVVLSHPDLRRCWASSPTASRGCWNALPVLAPGVPDRREASHDM